MYEEFGRKYMVVFLFLVAFEYSTEYDILVSCYPD